MLPIIAILPWWFRAPIVDGGGVVRQDDEKLRVYIEINEHLPIVLEGGTRVWDII